MCVLPAGGPNLPWAVTLAVAPRPALVLTLSPAVEGPGPRLSFGGFPWRQNTSQLALLRATAGKELGRHRGGDVL